MRVPRPSPAFARALALAAIRETFEETGLAIGVSDHGAPENPPSGAWTRFAATGVIPALDAIDFLARAITPPGRPRRFDARFFIADARFVAKRIEGAIHPQAELVELVWTPLNKALKLDLPEITRHALKDLAQALEGGLDKQRPRPFYRQLRGQAPARAALSARRVWRRHGRAPRLARVVTAPELDRQARQLAITMRCHFAAWLHGRPRPRSPVAACHRRAT